jgi:hypothetical protein
MFAWFKGKSFEEQVVEFDDKINQIVTSLVKSNEENIEKGDYDLTSLQNPEMCNEYTIFLASELEKRFKKVEVAAISDAIYVGKRRKNSQKKYENNMNINNYFSPVENKEDEEGEKGEGKYNKKDLCLRIASHYIRIFNIISAILTAINPKKNMCSRRIEALYKVTEDDIKNGFIRTCKSDDTDRKNPLYTNNILDIPGIQQLLNLYYFHLAQDGDIYDEENLEKIKDEFFKMLDSFYDVYSLVLDENKPDNQTQIQTQNTTELKNMETSVNQSLEKLTEVANQAYTIPSQQETQMASPQTDEVYQKINNLTTLLTDLKNQIQTQQQVNKNTISTQVVNQLKNSLSNHKVPNKHKTQKQHHHLYLNLTMHSNS